MKTLFGHRRALLLALAVAALWVPPCGAQVPMGNVPGEPPLSVVADSVALLARLRGFRSEGLEVMMWVFLHSDHPRNAEETLPVPPLAAMVDSAALAAAVAGVSTAPQASPLFRLGFDTEGTLASVEPVFDGMPAAYTDAVVAAIRTHARPQARLPRTLYTHLRVVGGPEPVVDRPPLAERAPVLRNDAEIMRTLGALARRHSRRGMVLPEYGVRVLADGTVDAESTVVVRSSGIEALDRAVVAATAQMRFEPGRVNGVPVAMPVRVPMFLRSP